MSTDCVRPYWYQNVCSRIQNGFTKTIIPFINVYERILVPLDEFQVEARKFKIFYAHFFET